MAIAAVIFAAFFFSSNHFSNKQNPLNDCGPEALLALLSDIGIQSTVEQISRAADTDREGTTMLGLKKAAEHFGLEARGMRLSAEDLPGYMNEGYHMIAFIKGNHYVWVKNIHPRGVVYKDVAPGFQFASTGNWQEMWYPGKRFWMRRAPGEGFCLIVKKGDGL